MNWYVSVLIILLSLTSGTSLGIAKVLDIAPFGTVRYWTDETGAIGKKLLCKEKIAVPQTGATEWNIGLTWEESRDITRLKIEYDELVSSSFATSTLIQYWFDHWPLRPPRMPKIEDRVDDPWQGSWLTAESDVKVNGKTVEYTFKPLSLRENPNAERLPNHVTYRNTLKVRLLYNQLPPGIKSISTYTPTQAENISIRIEFCRQDTAMLEGSLSVYNGILDNLSGWQWSEHDKLRSESSWAINPGDGPKGVIADLEASKTELPGSNDQTIVTIRSNNECFSFKIADLLKGPVYIPAYSVYITNASDPVSFEESKIIRGKTIREQLKTEPEQTWEQARREIPELDPTNRQYKPNRLWLPLAADASWQKFALEWGGNFYMGKKDTKAKGKELRRCQWNNDVLRWEIGTGTPVEFLRPRDKCRVSILKNYLPVVNTLWTHQGLNFEQEAFVTLLQGPLSPEDPERSEQTPAILMIKLLVANPESSPKMADIWLKGNSVDHLEYTNNFILDRGDDQQHLRMYFPRPVEAHTEIIRMPTDSSSYNTLHQSFEVPGGETSTLFIYVPFVGDLVLDDGEKIASLDYNVERDRTIAYWENLIKDQTIFQVPEPKFNEMARAIIPHIRIGVTKDPKSGLYMVPAASFSYTVYANEACFQSLLLDRLGDFETVTSYMETFLQLQGSKPFKGTYTGDQQEVFHGAKVDDEYDYTAHEYNLDHGTVLWALGRHFLFTRDLNWLKRVRPNMIKACDWIIEQCRNTMVADEKGKQVLHYGLLPAGNLEDNDDWGFWFANNAYACLGLETTARIFRLAGFPEADRFEKAAFEYRNHLRSAVQRSTEMCPVVRLRDQSFVPYVPTKPYQRFRYFGPMRVDYYKRYGLDVNPNYRLSATREVLYGPMILISTGLVEANEPMADWILDDWEDNATMSTTMGLNVHGWVDDEYWFSRGGMVFQPNLQNPIKAYLLRNEIPAAIRHIYNNMVSCLYPDVNAFAEEYRMWGNAAGPFYKSADEAHFVHALCDLLVMEVGEELWLAPGTPRRWLEAGEKIELRNTSTIFGKVSYILQQGRETNTIEARIECPKRNRPDKIWLFVRAPFNSPIQSVKINGCNWEHWDSSRDAILLPNDKKTLNIIVSFAK